MVRMEQKRLVSRYLGICFCIMLILKGLVASGAPSGEHATSEVGLMAYWTFEEGNGGILHDLSGNNNHGTIYGATWTTGIRGNALSFDGTNDYVSVPESPSLNIGGADKSFSILMWAKRAAPGLGPSGPSGHVQTIFSQGGITKNMGLHVGWRRNDNFTCAFYQNDLTTPTSYPDVGEWHFWAVNYDGITNTRQIYRDAVLVANDTASEDYLGSGATTLGKYYTHFLQGTIDEERVYNHALSAEKVTQLYLGSRDMWRRVADMPTARCCFAAAGVDVKIYALGGRTGPLSIPSSTVNVVEEYNPLTDAWRTGVPMSTPRTELADAAAVVNGRIYVFGGYDGSDTTSVVEEYDPVTNTWRSRTPMPTARERVATAVVNGKIYVIGGKGGGTYVTTVEEYDPVTDSWRSRVPMPTARYDLAAAVVNGKIYAIGGWNGHYIAIVEEYDPATNSWQSRAPMPTGRGAAVVALNGKIYAIGGNDGTHRIATVEEYDPTTDMWVTRAPMPTPRAGLAALVVGERIYAIGGFDDTGTFHATVEEYTPFGPPEAPTVTVMSPNGGESWQGTQPITWEATDPQDDPLTYYVYYSPNGGATWTQLEAGLMEPSYSWDTTMVVDGVNYLVKVEAWDGAHTGTDVSDAPFEIANAPPIMPITTELTTTTVPPIIPITTYPANEQTETVPYGGYLRLAFFIDPKENWWVKWSFTGSNPEVGIKALAMEFGESFKFVQGMSYDAYALSEGKTSDSGTFTIPYTAQWAFMFVNLDPSQQSTTLTVTLQLIETTIKPPNSAPTVRVLRPNGGERMKGTYTLEWEATDPDGDVLTFTVSYSPNGGQTWTQLARDVIDTSYQWDTSGVQVGTNYLIKVEVSDGALMADDRSDAPFTIEREAETETEGVFIPSFGILETLGAIFLLLYFGKLQRTRIS